MECLWLSYGFFPLLAASLPQESACNILQIRKIRHTHRELSVFFVKAGSSYPHPYLIIREYCEEALIPLN